MFDCTYTTTTRDHFIANHISVQSWLCTLLNNCGRLNWWFGIQGVDHLTIIITIIIIIIVIVPKHCLLTSWLITARDSECMGSFSETFACRLREYNLTNIVLYYNLINFNNPT